MTTNDAINAIRYNMILEEPPGDHYRSVRSDRNGIIPRFLHWERQLAEQIMQKEFGENHVRGHLVALDYLLQALLEHGRANEIRFFVDSSRLNNFTTRRYSQSSHAGAIPQPFLSVNKTSDLLARRASMVPGDVWLDLHGGAQTPQALNVRSLFPQYAYPIVSLQHGLAHSALVHQNYLRLLMAPTYPFDSLICTSNASKEALASCLDDVTERLEEATGATLSYNGRIEVIPLCVDTETLRPREKSLLRRKLRLPLDSIVLLYVGYLSRMKADLLPIFPVIRSLIEVNREKNIHLVLAGSGPEVYIRILQDAARDNGLANVVHIMPRVTDSVKADLYCASDVFIGPCDSLEESFGLSPVEAMSCGLPQVVASWNGYRETVCHAETGFLIPTYWANCETEFQCTGDIYGAEYDLLVNSQAIALDTVALFQSLEILIRNPSLRASFSARSRARAIEHFSYRSIASKYGDLLFELAHDSQRNAAPAPRRRFDKPTYFTNFGHFATRTITDKDELQITDKAPSLDDVLRRTTIAELGDKAIVDSQLIRDIIAVCSHPPHETPCNIDSLHRSLGKLGSGRDQVRRHVLFLLKHGVLRPSAACPMSLLKKGAPSDSGIQDSTRD